MKSNTGFNEPVVVLRERGLKNLVSNARSFVLGFKNSDLKSLSNDVVHQSIYQNQLDGDALISNYFELTLQGS